MESRNLHGRSDFKGRLFFAHPGDVIYSKIDVRNGAIGVVPNEMGRVTVSSEYPVYRIKPEKAEPEYIKLLFRTRFFRSAINSMVSGTSGRKRVQPSQLEKVEISLPSLEVQQAIIAYWRKAQDAIAQARAVLKQLVTELDEMLRAEYRKQAASDVIRQRYLGVSWHDTEAWDTKSTRAAAYRLACPSFIPMSAFTEEVSELVRVQDKPDDDWPIYGVNNIEGVFLNSYQKGKDFNVPYKQIRRDWFFHNPTRANVGSLGIVPDVPKNAVTSPEYQVWRVKEDTPPGYVAVLINTSFFLELVQFHRVGAVKQRLYAENLLRIRIPPIPHIEQERIAEKRSSALEAIEYAKDQLAATRQEVEEMILGIRQVR